MTREEARKRLRGILTEAVEFENSVCYVTEEDREPLEIAIQALEQEPCDDAISRQAVLKQINCWIGGGEYRYTNATDYLTKRIADLSSVQPKPKTGHCKDCKYFEYDHIEKVYGIPLIVAHEICKKWGDGCKTREDGYCYMFEPQEGSDKK